MAYIGRLDFLLRSLWRRGFRLDQRDEHAIQNKIAMLPCRSGTLADKDLKRRERERRRRGGRERDRQREIMNEIWINNLMSYWGQ